MKCLICIKNKADKKGSHIVPHFILKRIDNEEGSKSRDKELGFVLSENNPTTYFGRAISPEKLKNLFDEVTDSLIEENTIPLIEDNIFCSDCEKKLSSLESEYSKTLKIYTNPDSNYKSTNSTFLSFLFWVSIIWRMSIAKNSGFKLINTDEKRLQRILSKYLVIDITKLKPNPRDNDLKKIGYKILRSPNYSDTNSTILFFHPDFEKPYYFFVDEFILTFYFRKHYINKNLKLNINLSKALKRAEFNTPFGCENIRSIKGNIIDDLKEYFYTELSKRFLSNLSTHLDFIHRKLGGIGQMDNDLKKEIYERMIYDDKKSGYKYTIKHKAQIILDVLKK